MHLRDLITRMRTRLPGHRAAGRLADIHMWTIRDRWTSRAQAFRDQTGRTFALLTLRVGDQGPSHINGAEAFRREAWAQFFPNEQAPPTLIVNVLNPRLKLRDPQIQTLHFDTHGLFDYHHATDPADIETLNRLGAQWDEGAGFVPYTPPPPKYAHVWRRFPVKDLPQRRLFRDMEPYMHADWGSAVQAAIQAIQDGGQIPTDVPPSVAAAAETLLYESIELAREDGRVWYINGQHRTEAMLRQGVEETVLLETRLIAERPLPGEIGQAGVST
ncbi:hypothetical protein [Mycolicibacterium fortuitum]|uniref:hypothetical protein n=1 Tax=Mycolicibacterium fortuitum TaxID=1766 RepID=UPI003AAC088B